MGIVSIRGIRSLSFILSCLKSLPAVVVLSYFTASEKENLRTERKQTM